MRDLALLVADKNMDFTMRGILSRPASLGIRSLDYEIRPHSGHDGGVRTTGPETLAVFRSQFRYGIVMLDWEGSGADCATAVELEQELDLRLRGNWGDDAKAIVIEPELEAWVWGSDNVLKTVMGWERHEGIRHWLSERGYEFDGNGKPERPKEALEQIMERLNRPRSSNLYKEITSTISLAKCVDPAFGRLRARLQAWFPLA
jgi:hypothetical protein